MAVHQKEIKNTQLYQDFKVWESEQDPNQLQKYQAYLAQHLNVVPDLFALSYNRHIRKLKCLKYRFALPPEHQWKNIVIPLQLMVLMQEKGIIENYEIVSIYRSKEANVCVNGALKSKHLGNYALDFQVLDSAGLPYHQDDKTIERKICKFWIEEGAQYKLGLGTYTQHRFHIDVQGYRTWGQSYKRDSSNCFKG